MKLPGSGTIALERWVRFKAPVKIGDTITATATVSGIVFEKNLVTLKLEWRNQRGELVIEGEMKVLAPRK